MNKKILILLLIFLSIFISACEVKKAPTNYHIGVNGIVLDKVSNNPDTVYEEETFALGIMLTNQGAEDVQNGILMVNFDDYFLELDSRQSSVSKIQQVSLEGKSVESPMGGADYLEYVFRAKTLGVIRESVNTKINFNICYRYSTDLTTEVCIDTRTRTTDQRNYACKGKEYTSNSGQGAPLAITKIESEMMRIGESVRQVFRIYIKNMHEGYTLNPVLDLCSNPTKNAKEINKLKVKAWISTDIALECNPEEVRLVEGETIARCYVKDTDLDDFSRDTVNYLTILRVLLEYDYVNSETFSLNIKRINEVDIKSPSVCGYYEIESQGKCVPLCEYCANNPTGAECTRNINASSKFSWSDASDFSCACSKEKCLALNKDGKCIFGYCPGNSYCCSSDECRDKTDGTQCGDNYVCLNNKCSKTTECDHKYGAQNYTCMNINSCANNTVLEGFCPGDENNVCCKRNK